MTTKARPTVKIDWQNNGDFSGTYDDVTARMLAEPGLRIALGRDTARPLSPPMVPAADGALINKDRLLSPENSNSPLYQLVMPGRPMRVEERVGETILYNANVAYNAPVLYNGTADVVLFEGTLDDITHQPDIGVVRTDVRGLGSLQRLLSKKTVKTTLYENIDTAAAMTVILDNIGWPADKRSLPVAGDTILAYWWLDGQSAWQAILDLVAVEGPPSLVLELPDGTFHFENRNYRTNTTRSNSVQQILYDQTGQTIPYNAPLPYNAPMDYNGTTESWHASLVYRQHFSEVYNRVTMQIKNRAVQASGQVWQYGQAFTLSSGQTKTIFATLTDPIKNPVVPSTGGGDFTTSGTATLAVSLVSGLAFATTVAIRFTASGSGSVTVSNLRLRAQAVTVVSEQTIEQSIDTTASVAKYDEHDYAVSGRAELSEGYAQAVVDSVALYYQEQRPTVEVGVVGLTGFQRAAMAVRRPSDRIRVVHQHLGLASGSLGSGDFWIESIVHEFKGSGKLHTATYLCTKSTDSSGSIWGPGLYLGSTSEWDPAGDAAVLNPGAGLWGVNDSDPLAGLWGL